MTDVLVALGLCVVAGLVIAALSDRWSEPERIERLNERAHWREDEAGDT